MAFAEALSDDGSLTGRGRPVVRGLCDGRDDDSRGDWAYYAVSDFDFPPGHIGGNRGSCTGISRNQLGPQALHGNSTDSCGITGVLGGALVFAAGIWIGSA